MVRRSFAVLLVSTSLVAGAALPSSAGPRVPRFVTKGPFGEVAPVARAIAGDGFAISRKDGNDVKGPLDLASMKITRGGKSDAVSITAQERVDNDSIKPENGNFAILIDTNDNRKYDFGQYLFFSGNHLHAVLVNLRTNNTVDRSAPISRSSSWTLRTVIQHRKIDSPGTYRFAVVSYYQARPCSRRHPCIDAIPNRFPLIPLDHRDREVTWGPFSRVSDATLGDPSTTVQFTLADDKFGTGVKSWKLQSRAVGTTTWTTEDSGGGGGLTSADLSGSPGDSLQVRVLVVDKQKNERASTIKSYSFPYDETDSTIFSFGAGWSAAASAQDPYFGAAQAGSDGSIATVNFSGTSICILGGPTAATASAEVKIDGVQRVPTLYEQPTTLPRTSVWCWINLTTDPHTAEVEVTSTEPLIIDGVYLESQ
jgi:hypothetical protein